MIYAHDYGQHSAYVYGSLASKRLSEKIHLERISNFVETGTYIGDGVSWALTEEEKSFDTITSVEYAKGLADTAKQMFAKNEKVSIIHGNSPDILSQIVPKIKEPTLFFLDAHEGGGYGVEWDPLNPCPLLNETSIILDHFYDLDQVVIVIDDERMLHGKCPGYPHIETLNEMYLAKGLIGCYLDDSMVFCKPKWLRHQV